MRITEISKEIKQAFCKMCKELGLSIQPESAPGFAYTELFAKGKHGLLMCLDLRDFCLDLYVVRLIDEDLRRLSSRSRYPDGTWRNISVDKIYGSVQPPRAKNPFEWTEDQWGAHLLQVMKYYMDLIRNDPQRLLDFMGRIDDSPMNPPVE